MIFFLSVFIFLLSRILPFYLHGPHPLGYDTGFYYYNLENDRKEMDEGVFFNFRDGNSYDFVESPGSEIINKIFIYLGFSNDFILYWFYILVGLANLLLIYFLVKKTLGESSAVISSFVYSISYTQYLAYWFMLWKNSVGILLTLSIIYLLSFDNKVGRISSFFLFLFLIFFHKTSAILLLITFTVYLLFSKKVRKLHLVGLAVLLIVFVFLYSELIVFLIKQVYSGFLMNNDPANIKEGIFIEFKEYIKYSFAYLPFSILGMYYAIKKSRESIPIIILTTISFLFIITNFVFYKRLIIFFDLGMIFFFGYGFLIFWKELSSRVDKIKQVIFLFFLFFISLTIYFNWITRLETIMKKEEIYAIIEIQEKYNDFKILYTGEDFNSWLFGFSGHQVIFPEWDDWNYLQSEEKMSRIEAFEESLLIYSFQKENFPKVAENIYLYNFKN